LDEIFIDYSAFIANSTGGIYSLIWRKIFTRLSNVIGHCLSYFDARIQVESATEGFDSMDER